MESNSLTCTGQEDDPGGGDPLLPRHLTVKAIAQEGPDFLFEGAMNITQNPINTKQHEALDLMPGARVSVLSKKGHEFSSYHIALILLTSPFFPPYIFTLNIGPVLRETSFQAIQSLSA